MPLLHQDELRDEQRRPKRKWSVTPSRSGTLSDEEQEDDIYLGTSLEYFKLVIY